jgi:hypothetical protein
LPPVVRRIRALIDLVNAEKSTSKSRPYTDFEPLKIVVYNPDTSTEALFTTSMTRASTVICEIDNSEMDHRIVSIGGSIIV